MKNRFKYTIRKILNLYIDGFQNMASWGRQLWIIIFIKLFIMFAVLKFFFFPNFLKSNFETDEARSNYVIERLTNPSHDADTTLKTNKSK